MDGKLNREYLAFYLANASSAERRAVIMQAWDSLSEKAQIELAFMASIYANQDTAKAADNCIMFH